jgi:hypothetical protein
MLLYSLYEVRVWVTACVIFTCHPRQFNPAHKPVATDQSQDTARWTADLRYELWRIPIKARSGDAGATLGLAPVLKALPDPAHQYSVSYRGVHWPDPPVQRPGVQARAGSRVQK